MDYESLSPSLFLETDIFLQTSKQHSRFPFEVMKLNPFETSWMSSRFLFPLSATADQIHNNQTQKIMKVILTVRNTDHKLISHSLPVISSNKKKQQQQHNKSQTPDTCTQNTYTNTQLNTWFWFNKTRQTQTYIHTHSCSIKLDLDSWRVASYHLFLYSDRAMDPVMMLRNTRSKDQQNSRWTERKTERHLLGMESTTGKRIPNSSIWFTHSYSIYFTSDQEANESYPFVRHSKVLTGMQRRWSSSTGSVSRRRDPWSRYWVP